MNHDASFQSVATEACSVLDSIIFRLNTLISERPNQTDQAKIEDLEMFWSATRRAISDVRIGTNDLAALKAMLERIGPPAHSPEGGGGVAPEIVKSTLSELMGIVIRLVGYLPAPAYMDVQQLKQMVYGMVGGSLNERENKINDLTEEAKKALEILRQHNLKADKLLAAVGEKGGALGYNKHAEAGKRSRRFWQVVTIVGFLSWLALSVFAYLLTFSRDPTAGLALRNLAVGLPFVLLCGFGAMQVSHSNKVEIANRRLELQLLAMEPLMASLSDDQRNEVRKLVIPQFLSSNEQGGAHHSVDDSVLVARVLGIVEQLAKKSA